MKKLAVLLQFSIAAAISPSFADTETIGGVTWTYSIKDEKARVEGVDPATGAITIPSILGGCQVTSINAGAFSGCSGLTSITIPLGVTSIGAGAFSGCSGLASVTMPSGVTSIERYLFKNCSGLTSVIIPDGVMSIGWNAFEGCSELTSVMIPDGVTSIEYSAFQNCAKVREVIIGSPISNTSMRYLFPYSYSAITNVVINGDATSIRYEAFYGFSGLTSVTIPVGVTSIGYRAFADCNMLTSVTIPEGVTNIGSGAFLDCSRLKSVSIPISVKSIGSDVFPGPLSHGMLKTVICDEGDVVRVRNMFSSAGYDTNNIEFIASSYKVTFEVGLHGHFDDAEESVQHVLRGERCVPPAVVCDSGWKFLGWDGDVTRPITSDVNFAAQWEQIKYSIDIDGIVDDGCVYGQEITAKTFSEKTEGFTNIVCRGWIGTGDVPATGIGTQVTFTVTQPSSLKWQYATNYWISVTASEGGSVALTDATSVSLPNEGWYLAGTNLTIEATANEEWEFVKWDGDFSSKQNPITITADVAKNVTAIFKPIIIISNISYTNLRGAAHANPATYQEATAFAFAAPTTGVTGYTFDKWVPAGITADMTGDQVVTANWTANCYTLVFLANGGIGTMPGQAFVYDTPQKLSTNAFSRVGYEFAGWRMGDELMADGQQIVNLVDDPDATVELVAQWDAVGYAIEYRDTHGCSNDNPNEYTIEDPIRFNALQNPLGYEFRGWNPSEIAMGTVGDMVVTAQWEKVDVGIDTVLGGNWKSGTTAQGGDLIFSTADETAAGGLSVRLKSEDECATWIETKVTGEMWVSFEWKTSCETYSDLELDRIEFSIDGRRRAWANGETDWTNLTFAVRGTGEHTLRWTYVKDESDYMGEDCAWVANVTTTPKTAVATPTIDLAATYDTETTTCTITTETAGATILYKFDFYGDDSEWYEYRGPFEVSGTTKVVAYAAKRDYYDSETASAACERTLPWTLGECVNAANLDFATGGDGDWLRTTAVTHDGVAAIRSGAIGDGKQSWVKVQMLGPGTLSFWWRADSEYYKKNLLDYATFKVDGKEIAKIGGTADWTQVSHSVTGTGLHTYLWTYAKNAQTASGEDCVWIDEVSWMADTANGITIPEEISGGGAFAVGTEWKDARLDEKFGFGKRDTFHKRYGVDLTAALLKKSGKRDANGNARYVWQDYVMGTDPTDKESEFVTSVEMIDGVPNITWSPDLKTERTYKIWGSANLVNGGDWEWPTNALHRFFKVTVEMP